MNTIKTDPREIQEALRAFFPLSDIEFRPGTTNFKKDLILALPYITNRAVQNRLDDVLGAENWRNDYSMWRGSSQLCGISLRINGEWISKTDGATDTKAKKDDEGMAVKGGLSDSMKRAAVQWGIGRYLYDLDPIWVPAKEKQVAGKTTHVFAEPKAISLPAKFLPVGDTSKPIIEDIPDTGAEELFTSPLRVTEEQAEKVAEWIAKYALDSAKLKKRYGIKSYTELTPSHLTDIIGILTARGKSFMADNALFLASLHGDSYVDV